jgi:GNAT superfamily N-acetyltransferase
VTGTTIRPATAGDLDQVYEIWHRAETQGFPDPPPRGGRPPIFQHEFETGEMYVAEDRGRILGYTAFIRRDQVIYLSEFYVWDDVQSSGIGKALLGQVLSRGRREPSLNEPRGTGVRSAGLGRRSTCCTLSSADPRALGLYIRAGMQPRWPHFLLYADGNHLAELPRRDIEIAPAEPDDPELARWDADAGGRHRPQDHAYWIAGCGATPLWLSRGGETVGYGYVQRRNHEIALWYPKALSLGPVGARSAAAALDCACAIVAWAAVRAPALALGVPAAHPCLPVLLDAGFRITYVETFVSTAGDFPADPACYLPSGSTLF